MNTAIALNLNELETISAGTPGELADDSRFLNTLNGSTDRYGAATILFGGPGKGNEIGVAWSKVGVRMEPDYLTGNTYSIDGKTVTQQEAREYAMMRSRNTITESDWNW